MGGATAAVAPDSTAFGDRSAPFMLSFDGGTSDPDKFESVRSWLPGEQQHRARLKTTAVRVRARSHSDRTPLTGERWNLRWIIVHMIEEYALPCGRSSATELRP